MSSHLLDMKGIGKRYPGVIALEAVDLSVGAGEVVALIGENGAGKSTLMKILGGVITPDAGAISISGRVVEIDSPADARALGIEFIHQELSVLDNLDLAANLFLNREPVRGGLLKLIDSRRIYSEAEAHLRRLGLNLSSRTILGELALAQRQLVEIARALAAGARLIIMDEPTSSLTLGETQRLLDIIRELKAQGVSVIYISHRLDEVRAIADRVVALRDGRNAGELQLDEIEHDRLVKMMVGRDLQEFYHHTHENKPPLPEWFQVRGLRTVRYPHHEVSFGVARGEVLGLAGLVGAGRSELARAIFGVDPRTGGDMLMGGESVRVESPRDAIDAGIYLIPEDRRGAGLVVDFNIRQNITLPGLKDYSRATWIESKRETARAIQMCGALKIKTPSPESRAATLSGGNQQKVVLGKWLALEPKVIIFDEPTRGIDVGAKAEIYTLMRDLAARGVAMIAVSSDMEEVLGISDRIAVMHEGRLTGILNRESFSEEAVMRLATGGG